MGKRKESRQRVRDVQLLEIAVGNVVAAPVWNSIELNAVGELHLVLRLNPLPFPISLLLSSRLQVLGPLAHLDVAVIGELVRICPVAGMDSDSAARVGVCTPSSARMARRSPGVVGGQSSCARNRGGILGSRCDRNRERLREGIYTRAYIMERRFRVIVWYCRRQCRWPELGSSKLDPPPPAKAE